MVAITTNWPTTFLDDQYESTGDWIHAVLRRSGHHSELNLWSGDHLESQARQSRALGATSPNTSLASSVLSRSQGSVLNTMIGRRSERSAVMMEREKSPVSGRPLYGATRCEVPHQSTRAKSDRAGSSDCSAVSRPVSDHLVGERLAYV